MIHAHDIRAQIIAVLRRDIEVADFERWLAAESWNMFRDSAPDAQELVSAIHHLLSERDDSVINDSEFRAGLSEVILHSEDPVVVTATTSISAPILINQHGLLSTGSSVLRALLAPGLHRTALP